MTISSGDKAIMLNSADGTQTPYFMSSNIASGDKFILTQTADGALVPMNVSTDVANSDKCFMAMTADGKGVLVKGAPSLPLNWSVLAGRAITSDGSDRNWTVDFSGNISRAKLLAVESYTSGILDYTDEGYSNLAYNVPIDGTLVLSSLNPGATAQGFGYSGGMQIEANWNFPDFILGATMTGTGSVEIFAIDTTLNYGTLNWATRPMGIKVGDIMIARTISGTNFSPQPVYQYLKLMEFQNTIGKEIKAIRIVPHISGTFSDPGSGATYDWRMAMWYVISQVYP